MPQRKGFDYIGQQLGKHACALGLYGSARGLQPVRWAQPARPAVVNLSRCSLCGLSARGAFGSGDLTGSA